MFPCLLYKFQVLPRWHPGLPYPPFLKCKSSDPDTSCPSCCFIYLLRIYHLLIYDIIYCLVWFTCLSPRVEHKLSGAGILVCFVSLLQPRPLLCTLTRCVLSQ